VVPEAACLLSTDSLHVDLEDPYKRRGLFKGLRIKVKDCFLKSCTVGQKIKKQHFRKEDSMEPPKYIEVLFSPQKRAFVAKPYHFKRLRYEKETPIPNLFRLLRIKKVHCGVGLGNRAYRNLFSGQDSPSKEEMPIKI
jgi:hypothetical protein